MAYRCPRCSGYVVATDPEEPYCLICGHRTAWSRRPSYIGSNEYAEPIRLKGLESHWALFKRGIDGIHHRGPHSA